MEEFGNTYRIPLFGMNFGAFNSERYELGIETLALGSLVRACHLMRSLRQLIYALVGFVRFDLQIIQIESIRCLNLGGLLVLDLRRQENWRFERFLRLKGCLSVRSLLPQFLFAFLHLVEDIVVHDVQEKLG